MTARPLTIALTGATGLIGRAVTADLLSRGHHVRALVRRRDGTLPAPQFICDLPDRIDAAALDGCDLLVHAAYATHTARVSRAEAQRIDEDGTHRLLALARVAGVPRVLFVSTTSAHAGARSYYGISKFRLEQALDAQRDLVVRPGLVLAATGGFFNRVAPEGTRTWFVPLFDGGEQPMQIIALDDLVVGMRRAIEEELTGEVTLATPEVVSVRTFFAAIAAHRRRQVRFVGVASGPALAAFRLIEALHLPLPASSENLLGLLHLRAWNTAGDLRRLDLEVRNLEGALATLPRTVAVPGRR